MAAKKKRKKSAKRRSRRPTVVMVNPSRKRRAKRRAARTAAKATRRRRRRRNPTHSWGDAFFATLKGMAGGAIVYGIDYGASFAKAGAGVKAAITGGVGLVTSVLVSKWQPALGAGLAGGATFAVIGRAKEAMDLAAVATPEDTAGATPDAPALEGGAPRWTPQGYVRADSGRVFDFVRQDAGRVVYAPNPRATALATGNMLPLPQSERIREAGLSSYYAAPRGARRYGPQSWTASLFAPTIHTEGGRVIKVVNRYSA